MRAVPGFLLLVVLLTGVAYAVAKWGVDGSSKGIYANGVFLTVDAPDVPPWAEELLGRMRTVHTADELKAALQSGIRVVIYDCSASGLLDENFFSFNLPNGYGLVGIKVERPDLQSPPGCTRNPAAAPFFSFEHWLPPGDTRQCGASGSGGARFDEGRLFQAFLERELRLNGQCDR